MWWTKRHFILETRLVYFTSQQWHGSENFSSLNVEEIINFHGLLCNALRCQNEVITFAGGGGGGGGGVRAQ